MFAVTRHAAWIDDPLQIGLNAPPWCDRDLIGCFEHGFAVGSGIALTLIGIAEVFANEGMREGDAGNVSKPSGNESDEIKAAVDVAIDKVDVSWREAAANEETTGTASGLVDFLVDDAIKSVVGAHVVREVRRCLEHPQPLLLLVLPGEHLLSRFSKRFAPYRLGVASFQESVQRIERI